MGQWLFVALVFKSDLSNRFQRAVIENVASEWSLVTLGVPQGSILGSLLFTIFISDLTDTLSPNTNAALYADDSKVYRPILGNLRSTTRQARRRGLQNKSILHAKQKE